MFIKRVFNLGMHFGTFKSPKCNRSSTSYYCPSHPALHHTWFYSKHWGNIVSDSLFLNDEQSLVPVKKKNKPWRILIVDDEADVHIETKLSLSYFNFEDRDLEFLDAYTGAEAKKIIANNPDIVLVLLDVVMEEEQAGLAVVKYIRDDLNNRAMRIVLLTGQPGHAPEQKMIRDYDIDYQYKSELTSSKLHTLCYANLRSYRDIQSLRKSKKGLEQLIFASKGISSRQAFNSFVFVTLKQLVTLLNLDVTNIFACETEAFKIIDMDLEIFSNEKGLGVCKKIKISELPLEKRKIIIRAISEQQNIFNNNQLVMYCTNANHTILFYAKTDYSLSELDRHIMSIFTENLIVILENIRLNEMIDESQREIIYRLGEVIESRSNETGNHVKRVAHYVEQLALLVGLPQEEVEMIKLASTLHDIGKIGIPDAILHKQGPLDAEEWEIMKTHAQKGYDILKNSNIAVMSLGASICLNHHERWNGSGYPRGLSKNAIPIHGRITALADVFDALGNKRRYKQAWRHEKIVDYLEKQSNAQFDPRLVTLLLENIEHFLEIKEMYLE